MRSAFERLAPARARNILWLHRAWQDRQPWPELVELPARGNVLVVAPHYDDESIGAGGTLAKHAQAGDRIGVAFMTDGSRGDPATRDPSASAAVLGARERELSQQRRREASEAAGILGIGRSFHLDAPDERLAPTPGLVRGMRQVLGETRPDLVYLPFATDRMPDHRAANAVLLAAAERDADFLVCGYEVWNPIYPNVMVDISRTFDKKCSAIRAHKSQMRHNDYISGITGLNHYRALCHLGGVGQAEAFYRATLGEYRRLCRALGI